MAQVNYEDSGLVFIKKVTGSAVSEIIVDNCFSADYSQYKIILDVSKDGATNRSIDMRMRAGGVTNSNSEYNYQNIYAASTTKAGVRNSSASAFVNIIYCTASNATRPIAFFEIMNPFQSTYTTALWQRSALFEGASIEMDLYAGGMDVTTSYDGFTVYPTAETITGTVYVYGYKES